LWEGGDDAGNPGPVYGQKDQAPTQGYKQTSKTNDKEGTGMQVQQTIQGRPNTQGGKQTSKENTRRKRDRERKARGGDTPPTTGPEEKWRDKGEEGARPAGRETTSQLKTKGA